MQHGVRFALKERREPPELWSRHMGTLSEGHECFSQKTESR